VPGGDIVDVDKLVQTLNNYARDYVLHLIGFFDHRDAKRDAEHIADADGKIFVHGAISLILGFVLQQIFMSGLRPGSLAPVAAALSEAQHGKLPGNDEILVFAAYEFGFWIFFALTTYVLIAVIVGKLDFQAVLSVILRVFPPAFIIGASAIMFISKGASIFLPPGPANCEGWYGVLGDAAVEWILVAFALPFALSQPTAQSAPAIPTGMKWRKAFIVTVVVILMIYAHVIVFKPTSLTHVIGTCF